MPVRTSPPMKACDCRRRSGLLEDDRKARVTAEKDAGPSYGCVVRVEHESRRLREQLFDRDTSLEASERRADAEVEAAPERIVDTRAGGVEIVVRAARFR